MNWVKSRPKGFPKEVLSKCKFIRPDGTKIDLNPSATPKRTAETSGDELIARKKVKPNPAPAADSSSPDVTPLRSPRGR